MADATTGVDQWRPASWMNRYLKRIGDRVFADDDRVALDQGWEITVTCGGLGRTYRDPRLRKRFAAGTGPARPESTLAGER